MNCGLLFVQGKKKLMKKISLFISAIVLAATAFAQDAAIGLKGGLNISNLSDGQGNERGAKAGFHGGLLAQVRIDRSLALQPELVYSSQGARYTVNDGEHELALNYIN